MPATLRNSIRILLAFAAAAVAFAGDRPGYLGLGYENHPQWFYVRHVIPGSPAARAGLRTGDVITAIDGRPPHYATDRDAAIAMARIRPGQKIRFSVARADQRLVVIVTAARMTDEIWKRYQAYLNSLAAPRR